MPDPNDLIFIKDVIYGLKTEYGSMYTISRKTETTNLTTGAITQVGTDFPMLIIAMPETLRQMFAKQIGSVRQGYLPPAQRELLIDIEDIPVGFEARVNDTVIVEGKTYNLEKIENYIYAMILLAQKV